MLTEFMGFTDKNGKPVVVKRGGISDPSRCIAEGNGWRFFLAVPGEEYKVYSILQKGGYQNA